MKIVVNDIAACSAGALTVLKSFYQYIKENDFKNEYVFLLSEAHFEETDRIKIINCADIKRNRIKKLLFDFAYGRFFIAKLAPDYVLSLQNIITFGLTCKQGVYVHQAIPFQNIKSFSFVKKRERKYAIYQHIIGKIIKWSIKYSNDVFVQTHWMKKAVEDCMRCPPCKVKVISMEKQNEGSTHGIYRCDFKHFFYPTTDENVYKNQECLYKASKLLEERKIKEYRITLTLNKKNEGHFDYTGFLSKEEMERMYSRSILVYPSYIETLGLPLLEAKHNKAVIFAADCPYAHDVLDGYSNAYFFHPMNPVALADLMERAILGKIQYHDESNFSKKEHNGSWEILVQTIKDGS